MSNQKPWTDPAPVTFLQTGSPPPPWPAAPMPNGQPPKRKSAFAGWKPWHWAALVTAGPVILALVIIGANTVAHHFIGDRPAVRASAGSTPTPTPHPAITYDLAGYMHAITGARERAFVSALNSVRADNQRSDFTTALNDAPNLITAADRWLRQLRRTNPPPSYRGAKATYVMAATMARQAGQTTLNGLQTTNLGLLQQGAAQADKAVTVLSRATAQGPRGS